MKRLFSKVTAVFALLLLMGSYAYVDYEKGFEWTTWSPTTSAKGSMTYTSVTVSHAEYFTIGKVTYFQVSITGTVGGTPNNELYATLPVATVHGDTDEVFTARLQDGGSNRSGACWLGDTGKILWRTYDGGNFTAGTVNLHCSGFYETA